MGKLDTSSKMQIIFYVIILMFILVQAYKSFKKSNMSGVSILLWFLIFAILIILYAFRFELGYFKNRVLAVLLPSYSWVNDAGQLVISRNQDGHFYVDGISAGNTKINFLIDTGASDIALNMQDARKLGIDTSNLRYTKRYNTANGTTYAAPVTISQLTIGKKTFYNLEAHVSSGDLDMPLLGMSLIGQFKDFKITNELLILSY